MQPNIAFDLFENIGMGVILLKPKYFEDFRGYYCETYSYRTLKANGIDTTFLQDNHVYSSKLGTIRGIHFQNNPFPQAKLIRCIRGKVKSYAIDLRRESPSFKKWVCYELSSENRMQLFIPRGFGHGVISLTEDCEIQYKVDNLYSPEHDRAIRWNDPEISIDWEIDTPILSPKDSVAPFLCDSDVNL